MIADSMNRRNDKLKCDLALLNESCYLEAMIEFKIGTTNDDLNIRADIDKLRSVNSCKKYMFVIGYGGDIVENNQYLTSRNDIELVGMRSIKTKFFYGNSGKIEDANLNIFMYEI